MATKPSKSTASNKPSTQPTHISVTFTIVTPDQLRQIIFNLTKSSDSNDDSWSVTFELDERKSPSKPFALVTKLEVAVDHNDSAKAAATAKHGMDSDQHAQALNAADTVKESKSDPSLKEDAEEDAKAVISARNPSSPA
jgi:hypothetical protein